MSDEVHVGEEVFERFRETLQQGKLTLGGIPVRTLPPGIGKPDSAFLVNTDAFKIGGDYVIRRNDDQLDALAYSFLTRARIGLRHRDDLTRPSRWRDRMREAWRLYRLSVREGWRGLDPHEPNPDYWRKQADRTLQSAVCMAVGHKIKWQGDGYSVCIECGASRHVPGVKSHLKLTSL